MKVKARKGIVFAGIIVAMMLPVVSFGFTAPNPYNWVATDGTGETGVAAGLDITKVSWTSGIESSIAYYYFKMDLTGPVVRSGSSGQSYYEILIDSNTATGVGTQVGTRYIDYILVAAYSKNGDAALSMYSSNNAGGFNTTSIFTPLFQPTGNPSILEWRIPKTVGTLHSSEPYWFGGATRNVSASQNLLLYTDISDTFAKTPIPSAAWLLGSGLVCLIGLQRRGARKA